MDPPRQRLGRRNAKARNRRYAFRRLCFVGFVAIVMRTHRPTPRVEELTGKPIPLRNFDSGCQSDVGHWFRAAWVCLSRQ